ncbi:MAG: hypothetical protein AB8B96_08670 [Lysobacterales bacterium]
MSIQKSRRDFLKKTGYSAPVVITLAATPAFAGGGSASSGGGGNPSGGQCRTVTQYRTQVRVISWWPLRLQRVRVPVRVRICN